MHFVINPMWSKVLTGLTWLQWMSSWWRETWPYGQLKQQRQIYKPLNFFMFRWRLLSSNYSVTVYCKLSLLTPFCEFWHVTALNRANGEEYKKPVYQKCSHIFLWHCSISDKLLCTNSQTYYKNDLDDEWAAAISMTFVWYIGATNLTLPYKYLQNLASLQSCFC